MSETWLCLHCGAERCGHDRRDRAPAARLSVPRKVDEYFEYELPRQVCTCGDHLLRHAGTGACTALRCRCQGFCCDACKAQPCTCKGQMVRCSSKKEALLRNRHTGARRRETAPLFYATVNEDGDVVAPDDKSEDVDD